MTNAGVACRLWGVVIDVLDGVGDVVGLQIYLPLATRPASGESVAILFPLREGVDSFALQFAGRGAF